MSSTQTSTRGAEIKKKQMIWLVGGGVIFMIVALGVTYIFTKNQPAAAPKDPPAQNISLVTGGSAYSEREAWRTQLGSDMANMQKQFAEFARDQQEKQRALLAARGKENEPRQDPASDLSPPVKPTAGQQPTTVAATGDQRPKGESTPPPPPLSLPPPPPRKAGAVLPVPALDPFAPPSGVAKSKAQDSIATVTFDDPSKGSGTAVDGQSGGMFETQSAENYVTTGTYARVVVLNGLNAPTGGQSQSNPVPVLMRVIGSAELPNGYRIDLDGCRITGNGIGVVESERARIRLDRISCVDPEGGAIDIRVNGYVSGSDGQEGVRGKLITKTGQMLSNALLASIGSGIGEAFKNASETQTQNALGTTTTTTNPGDGFQKGFGQGTQRAFDMLARYYITLAEKTFPVVEVQGGIVADVVFSRGFVIARR